MKIPFTKNPNQRLLLIMKNPSDGKKEYSDPSLNRVLRYAHHQGFDQVTIVNLFAFSTPKSLILAEKGLCLGIEHIIGPRNDETIKHLLNEYGKIIVAWGGPPRSSRFKPHYINRIDLGKICTMSEA